MSEEEYIKLLDRAFEKIPEGFHETERWKIPEVTMGYEGKNTDILNFKDIIQSIKRDEKHVSKFIVREVGTAGAIKAKKLVLKGKQK